jgi:hypothetical protein
MTRLLFLGDVYLPAPCEVRLEIPEHFIYNLESPLTTARTAWPGKVNLKCETDHTVATFGRRPTAVCLANNHVMDFGAVGFEETLSRLRTAGTPFFGAGTLADNCNNPLVLDVGARKIALMGYVCPTAHPVFATAAHPGVTPIALDRVRRDLDTARARGADRLVVCLHWGVEEIDLPKPGDVALARQIIDLGADLIIGHHAHCIQPFEIYRGKHIFYGLGNAIFPDIELPAFYDEAGRPTRNFVKKQQFWNKRSLGVEFDIDTGAVDCSVLAYSGRALERGDASAERYRLSVDPLDRYPGRFKRSFFYGTLRNKLVNYAHNPKVPRPRHLRSVMRILKESVWRGTPPKDETRGSAV